VVLGYRYGNDGVALLMKKGGFIGGKGDVHGRRVASAWTFVVGGAMAESVSGGGVGAFGWCKENFAVVGKIRADGGFLSVSP